LKQAKDDTGGGKFLRGGSEWSEEKKAYVFGLGKKPPRGLAKKIRKAILEQTLKKLQVKMLVPGPECPEIDADTDAATLRAVDLEDVTETATPPPGPPPPPPPGPPSAKPQAPPQSAGPDETKFNDRLKRLLPGVLEAQKAKASSAQELKLAVSEAQV